jgi:site-specific recombinase XerD
MLCLQEQTKNHFMQTRQTTGLRTMANDYVTIVEQACAKVSGFEQLYKEPERCISVTGKSNSTLTNYSRQLAHLALHYHCLPTEPDKDQVLDYLHLVKSEGPPSATFFKFTVYGMRYVCKMRGLDYLQFSLPQIDRPDKLPVVLNAREVKSLLKACTLLKHSILPATIYGCGLRCAEVRHLALADVDLQRGMLPVKNGKGGKDRYVPLGSMLIRGITRYLQAEHPRHWLFEGYNGACLSQRGTRWMVSQAVKKAGIIKEVSTHTLRHTYATHLPEQGLDIVTIKELPGHEAIETTMVYLHIAQPSARTAFCPLDNLYKKS